MYLANCVPVSISEAVLVKYGSIFVLIGGHLGFWRPYWIVELHFVLFVYSGHLTTCVPNLVLVSQTEVFWPKQGLKSRTIMESILI